MDTSRLPIYESHKRVRAGRIVGIEKDAGGAETIWRLMLAKTPHGQPDNDCVYLDAADHPGLFSRYTPKIGDYVLIYVDGYVSISPKDAFESGYTLETSGEALAYFPILAAEARTKKAAAAPPA